MAQAMTEETEMELLERCKGARNHFQVETLVEQGHFSASTGRTFSAFMIARPDRKPAANDADSAALLKSLMVYTGKFTIDGDKLTTNVDLSWNEILTGTAQVRFFKLEGDKLSIRTAEQASAVYPGKKVVGTLTWERER